MQNVDSIAKLVGSQLRQGRKRKALTLEQLGKATGLSSPFLSRLERGETSTSISNLIVIAQAIDIPLSAIFEAKETGPSPSYVLSKRQSRQARSHLAGPGYAFERLQGRLLGQRLEAFEIEYPVGAIKEMPFGAHGGEEILYLLSGRIIFQVGSDQFELGSGDVVHLLGQQPHRGWNVGDEPARMLMVHLSDGSPGLARLGERGAARPDTKSKAAEQLGSAAVAPALKKRRGT